MANSVLQFWSQAGNIEIQTGSSENACTAHLGSSSWSTSLQFGPLDFGGDQPAGAIDDDDAAFGVDFAVEEEKPLVGLPPSSDVANVVGVTRVDDVLSDTAPTTTNDIDDDTTHTQIIDNFILDIQNQENGSSMSLEEDFFGSVFEDLFPDLI